jgi:type IV secretory pathway VirB2 component (pilin)
VKTRKIIAALVAAFMVIAASAAPAQAAKKPAKTYNFKVTGTISGAAGKTVLLIADTGRVLGSQAIGSLKLSKVFQLPLHRKLPISAVQLCS